MKQPITQTRKLLNQFFAGMGTVFSIAPPDPPRIISDEEALASDWKAVGDDIRKATETFDPHAQP